MSQNVVPGPELKFDTIQYGGQAKSTPRGEVEIISGSKMVKQHKSYGPGTGKSMYQGTSVEVLPGKNGQLVIQTPGESPMIFSESPVPSLSFPLLDSIHAGSGYLKPTSNVSVQHSYGINHYQPWYETPAQIALVILLVWIGAKFLMALGRGVRSAFAFLWRVVTFPFRAIGWIARKLVTVPGRALGLVRSTKPVAVGMGRAVSGTYEAFAEAYNKHGGTQATVDRARTQAKKARTKLSELAKSGKESGRVVRAKARVLFAKARVDALMDVGASRKRVERARKHLSKAKSRLEAMGRNVGDRLGRLGLNSEEVALASSAGLGTVGTGSFATHDAKQRPHTFVGYKVIKELPRGGSGARLFLAKPKKDHARSLAERGIELPALVVIKSFSLIGGAHMTGILREGRALDAAKRLGQVLEHFSGDDGLFYVMPFVPGVTLDEYIAKLHGFDKQKGLERVDSTQSLNAKQLDEVLSLQLDLLKELERFHSHGLWHKDVKPGNLIVDKGRMYVVDLGLLTPLASALTLTTHGTEYYRDPEMVRLAMRGAQVRDVDAAKFDLYSAGAVLFSMLEGTFPSHGNLSRLTRPCPPALAWVVRRAMSEHESRYPSARAMREDLAYLLEHRDLEAIKPKHLPSWGAQEMAEEIVDEVVAHTPEPQFTGLKFAINVNSDSLEPEGAPELSRRQARHAAKRERKAAHKLARAERKSQKKGGWFKYFAVPAVLLGALLVVRDTRMQGDRMLAADTARTVAKGLGAAQKTLEPGWGKETVLDLIRSTKANKVNSVYVHGLNQERRFEGLNRNLNAALGHYGIQRVGFETPGGAAGNADKGTRNAELELMAGAARLLDPLRDAETPQDGDLLDFFIDHPKVQAILNYNSRTGKAGRPVWVISPLVRSAPRVAEMPDEFRDGARGPEWLKVRSK